jgi:hypothetical protein
MDATTNTVYEIVSLDQINGNQPYEFQREYEVKAEPKQTTKPYVRYAVPNKQKQAVNDPNNSDELL